MPDKYLGNMPEAALQTAKMLFAPGAKVRIINDGQENLVVVDEAQIVRFPRREEVWQIGRNDTDAVHERAAKSLATFRRGFVAKM